MKGRKSCKAAGGGIKENPPVKEAYAGGTSNVRKEAEEKKRGGKVVGKVHGHMAKKRMDRPGRKRGGRVGADLAPLSSAARTSHSAEDD